MKDYYKILGIEKSASKADIKKAFRTLAGKYHPDKKSGDEAKFKEISEAYSVLSDDKKRAEYDTYGRSYAAGGNASANWGGFQGAQGFEFDISDIFENFGDMFGGGFGGGRRQRRGNDVSVDIELSFKEAVLILRDCSACTFRAVSITFATLCLVRLEIKTIGRKLYKPSLLSMVFS